MLKMPWLTGLQEGSESMFEITRILCPTDFSDGSLEALTEATEIAL